MGLVFFFHLAQHDEVVDQEGYVTLEHSVDVIDGLFSGWFIDQQSPPLQFVHANIQILAVWYFSSRKGSSLVDDDDENVDPLVGDDELEVLLWPDRSIDGS